jgi:predicted exporter
MAAFVATHLRVSNEITHFLPAGRDARLAYVSRAIAESELSRAMVIAVEGTDPSRVLDGARRLAERLRAHPEVAWLRSGVDPAMERAVYDLYFPRRHAFLTDGDDASLRALLTDAGLTEAAREVRRQLASPAGALVARSAGADPLLAFPAQLARLRDAQAGTLTSRDGQFVTDDGRHAVILLATRHSAFDGAHQRPWLAALRSAFDDVNRAQGGGLRLRMGGAHRIAVAAEAQVRGDAERISLLGSLGVAALFLLIHRSMRYLLLASLPIAAGFLTATTVALLVFGKLHGLTLAFGASLIGVCFDYPVYLINHHTLRPSPDGPQATLRRVWPGTLLGALTTMGGLAGLAWTSFPGLREIAVFGVAGVFGALVATRVLVPRLLPAEPIPVRFQRGLADGVARVVAAMRRRGAAALVVPLVALGICAVGLPRVRWVDDARALTEVDPALFEEERAVRALVSRVDDGRLVIVTGDTEAEALARNDAVALRLAAAKRDGVIAGYRSLHTVLWSPSLQRRNEAALRGDATLPMRAAAAFEREGFRAGALDPFGASLRGRGEEPLTEAMLRASPLGEMARSFRVSVGARVGYLSFLQGVRDPSALARRVADVPEADVFEQGRFLRETYARYRRRTLELLGVGLVVVFALLLARYRRAGAALAAFVPSVLAAATALAVVPLTGAAANLMHLIGLLLVLSIGVDYGVFVAEIDRHPEAARETLFSVTVAWVSALLSFGLLAVSSNPSLRAIGLTTGVGVTFSLLLAPVARHLLGEKAS